MSKLKKVILFLPAIICLIMVIITCISDALYFTSCTKLLLNFAVMVFAGVLMCKGKVSGALLGIIFFTGWAVLDYIEYTNTPFDIMNQHLPAIWIIWPVILFYFICAVVLVYYKIKNRE